MKRKRAPQRQERQVQVGNVARSGEQTLTSYTVGSLPILNRVLARARIAELLSEYMQEDERCVIPPSVGVMVLVRNFLTSRQPLYGVAEWAARHAPEQLGLSGDEVRSLNDDRVGRCLDRLYEAGHRSLLLAAVMHVIKEFGVSLEELHNDSTTVTFSGEHDDASERLEVFGRPTRLITWGHNKDHRPDLKQLLYTLTVTRDGAVPVHFAVDDGNLTDDQTHRESWDLVCELAGGPDFLYVADSKLATDKNMAHIHSRGGRFITVLPRTRGEDKAFRARLTQDQVAWTACGRRPGAGGDEDDEVSLAEGGDLTKEGYRLLWFHSSRKASQDAATRSRRILRTIRALEDLQARVSSPRTRYTAASKVTAALEKTLAQGEGGAWMRVEVVPQERERFKQSTPGRPGKRTEYRREVKTRFAIRFEVDHARVAQSAKEDGCFPLVTNDPALSPLEVLQAYKRQAVIEKRFSQLKTDYQLAPVFLKAPHRIEAMLCVYFFALLTQALLERELRLAMKEEGLDALPLYPEERDCGAPTARKAIDLFEQVQRHELRSPAQDGGATRFATELSRTQKRVLRLLNVPLSDYQS